MQCPNEYCLQFGMEAPTFTPLDIVGTDPKPDTIISRGISTVPVHLNFLIQVNYTLIMVNSPDCLGNNGSFTASPPRLQYRVNGTQMWRSFKFGSYNDIDNYAIVLFILSPHLFTLTEKVPNRCEEHVSMTNYLASIDRIIASELPVQFRFVQLEHRGGFCDCWAVANLTVTPPSGQTTELSYVSYFSEITVN